MIATNIHLTQETQQILIKAAALKNMSVENLASEILNEVIPDKLSSMMNKDTETKPKRKPALAGTEPFIFYGTSEESGLPADEWDMEKE